MGELTPIGPSQMLPASESSLSISSWLWPRCDFNSLSHLLHAYLGSGWTVSQGPVIPVTYGTRVVFSTNLHRPLSLSTYKLLAPTPAALMSNSHPIATASTSSNFQLIFNNLESV